VSINISDLPDKVIFTVSDTGIGIDKKHIPRLCERFYRVDKSRSKKTGGTGLGLAIVKHVCALYEAELNIESEENEGTTVSVTFRK
ncbi:MAG: ATP-binding protein, partial [Christensenellales bacterium]